MTDFSVSIEVDKRRDSSCLYWDFPRIQWFLCLPHTLMMKTLVIGGMRI